MKEFKLDEPDYEKKIRERIKKLTKTHGNLFYNTAFLIGGKVIHEKEQNILFIPVDGSNDVDSAYVSYRISFEKQNEGEFYTRYVKKNEKDFVDVEDDEFLPKEKLYYFNNLMDRLEEFDEVASEEWH